MDPDQTLVLLRYSAQRAMRVVDEIDGPLDEAQLLRLLDDVATQALALDGWLTGGGALPEAWRTS